VITIEFRPNARRLFLVQSQIVNLAHEINGTEITQIKNQQQQEQHHQQQQLHDSYQFKSIGPLAISVQQGH
jgi:hypothetical protein